MDENLMIPDITVGALPGAEGGAGEPYGPMPQPGRSKGERGRSGDHRGQRPAQGKTGDAIAHASAKY